MVSGYTVGEHDFEIRLPSRRGEFLFMKVLEIDPYHSIKYTRFVVMGFAQSIS